MDYNFVDSLTPEQTLQLHQLYQQAWWSQDRTLPDINRMLMGNTLIFAAIADNQQLIAFARVLSDGVYKALIFDVIVAESYRGLNLGRQMVNRIVNDPRLINVKHLELYCLPDLIPFYERWGFSNEVASVQLMRRQIK